MKEDIGHEVEEFAAYWPGEVLLDSDLHFFRAIGGGQPWNSALGALAAAVSSPVSGTLASVDNFLSWWRSGASMNLVGEGLIGGGCMVLGPGGSLLHSELERVPGHRPDLAAVVSAVRAASAVSPASS